MFTSVCNIKYYKGLMEKTTLNPLWKQMCEEVAKQTVWIGIITLTQKLRSKKINKWKNEKPQKGCFCSHSYFSRLPSDLPGFRKSSAPGSLLAEELHTSQMQRCNTHLTSISIFPSWVVWCLRRQRRPHFYSVGATQVSLDLAMRSISL